MSTEKMGYEEIDMTTEKARAEVAWCSEDDCQDCILCLAPQEKTPPSVTTLVELFGLDDVTF
jgi:hypothetical protein